MPHTWRSRLVLASGLVVAVLAAVHLAGAETFREPKTDLRSLEKKVDEVLSNQRIILQKLEDVLEELRIVKVRATHS
jgi:hypothetical protein